MTLLAKGRALARAWCAHAAGAAAAIAGLVMGLDGQPVEHEPARRIDADGKVAVRRADHRRDCAGIEARILVADDAVEQNFHARRSTAGGGAGSATLSGWKWQRAAGRGFDAGVSLKIEQLLHCIANPATGRQVVSDLSALEPRAQSARCDAQNTRGGLLIEAKKGLRHGVFTHSLLHGTSWSKFRKRLMFADFRLRYDDEARKWSGASAPSRLRPPHSALAGEDPKGGGWFRRVTLPRRCPSGFGPSDARPTSIRTPKRPAHVISRPCCPRRWRASVELPRSAQGASCHLCRSIGGHLAQ